MSDVEKLLERADEHSQAMAELEAEAAKAGRKLTEGEQDYMDELRQQHKGMLDTASTVSRKNTMGNLGRAVTTDVSGNILNDRDIKEAKNPAKTPTTAGHIAD